MHSSEKLDKTCGKQETPRFTYLMIVFVSLLFSLALTRCKKSRLRGKTQLEGEVCAWKQSSTHTSDKINSNKKKKLTRLRCHGCTQPSILLFPMMLLFWGFTMRTGDSLFIPLTMVRLDFPSPFLYVVSLGFKIRVQM